MKRKLVTVVAEVVAAVFLVSDAGGYVTGTTIPVEGGMLTS